MDRYIKQAREDITAQLMRSQGSQKINNVQLLLHSNSPRYYSAHPRLSLLILQRYFFSLARARATSINCKQCAISPQRKDMPELYCDRLQKEIYRTRCRTWRRRTKGSSPLYRKDELCHFSMSFLSLRLSPTLNLGLLADSDCEH